VTTAIGQGTTPASESPPEGGAVAGAPFPPEVMTLPDLAKYLRFSEQHTRKLADGGRLEGWKLGSAWGFLKTSIASAGLRRRLWSWAASRTC
jgi:hypothetical protein